MLYVKSKHILSLITLALLSGCLLESTIEVKNIAKKKSSNTSISHPILSNTAIDTDRRQLTLSGENLSIVTQVRITDGGSFNEIYDIDSQNDSQILISAKSALAMITDQIYDIILTSASGNTTFQTSFTLGAMGATNGDVLQYDGSDWNPIPLPLSGISLQGTWDATGTTTSDAKDLQDGGFAVAGAPTSGDYFIVSVAGTTSIDGGATWNAGDWIIFNGSTWDRINNTTGVSSFNGRSGGVNPASGDYFWSEIANAGGS
jgi:hypothetical protein